MLALPRDEHPYTIPDIAYTRATELDASVRARAGPHATFGRAGMVAEVVEVVLVLVEVVLVEESADEEPQADSATSRPNRAQRTRTAARLRTAGVPSK